MKLLYKIRSLQNKVSNEKCQCITDLKLERKQSYIDLQAQKNILRYKLKKYHY